MLVTPDHKRSILRLESGSETHTHQGIFNHDDLIGIPWGSQIESHLGSSHLIVEPSLRDLLLQTQRRSQIIFPKDIGYILLRLSVGPGKTIAEAGTGSGALTTAFAWMVGAEGRVVSYDRREDMQTLAAKNLEKVGLADRVEMRLKDIKEGFDLSGVDALFLDLPSPHIYLPQVRSALKPGGVLGTIVPTANQVSDLLTAFDAHSFGTTDVCEILLRFYKLVPDRLRPTDRMVAHTGYLVFSRPVTMRRDA